MSDKILIVEDNEEIRDILKLYLEGHNFSVETAVNGAEGLERIENGVWDMILVDIMMPEMDGYTLVQEVRKRWDVPIMIISAKKEDSDKIIGLNIGADDYITKPFNPLEVVARVRALLRRYKYINDKNKDIIEYANLILDKENSRILKNGREMSITATEYKILSLMIRNPERILSKSKIGENIYGSYYETDDNTITVHVSHIRDKIESKRAGDAYIKTVKGLGYKLDK